ncbi:HlyD family efflux transporter periplasmic adaptor subunit [Paragemmobacter straminiformis]|uniref:HlyD family efflux transporter periplasmic adaptor subunit n=1 Tax=Paragemmobacter straminiformis TaxID=2045119 RepID=A0A842I9D6_9RHOB|nr:HlyD family efflux transporter periplasmic adaptor subunit [Gemmobacter straminiformis]MBC2836201.1 HlyD family efflux transporter periplasmic adaptor subunit [Gemmobacter straminiformis]
MTTFDMPLAGSARRAGLTVWLIAATLGLFLLWAGFAWVDEIVRAPGQVVPSSRPQIIQNLEGGILAELTVAEGDVVQAGQTLARLQGTQYQATVDDLTDQIAALDIRRLRLEAEKAGKADFDVPAEEAARVPDIVASERALLAARQTDFDTKRSGAEAVLKQAARELEMTQKMFDRDVAAEVEVTRAKKEKNDAEARLNEVVTTTDLDRASEYAKVQADLASFRQKLKLSQDQLARTVLVAPMRGVVNRLAITTIGGVVRPGEEILEIIPLDEELFIEAKVKPSDIASVRLGQEATVKLSAYDYTIYGTLKGAVTFISADTFKDDRSRDPNGDPHYKVTLRVDMSKLTERQHSLEIRPGMQAEVELLTGGKTVLTYLTKPLWRGSEALTER